MLGRMLSRGIVVALVCALASCGADQPRARTLNAGIEGRWLLPNGADRVEIAPCGATLEQGFCGAFLPADPDAEDTMNSDIFAWGRSLNKAQVVQDLLPGEAPGAYHGSYYLPDLGDTLRLEIRQLDKDRLEALVYYGAHADEIAEMAITSMFAPLAAADTGWLAIRAAIGKEVLGAQQIWRRDTGGRP